MSGTNDDEWRDAANWRAGWLRVYVSSRDRRVLVPMRPRWLGWTVNLGLRRTWVWLLAMLAIMLAVVLVVAAHLGAPGSPASRGV